MTRTIEEIRETYKDTRSEIDDAVASYHGYKKDSPFVKQLEDILFLLDHIAELQAANAALQAQVERVRAHVPDWELQYWGDLPDESPTAAVVADLESEDEDCPVCGGTGWIQEGWGEYHTDGIPCLACEEREEE